MGGRPKQWTAVAGRVGVGRGVGRGGSDWYTYPVKKCGHLNKVEIEAIGGVR